MGSCNGIFLGLTVYYSTRDGGISILEGSIFWVGWGFKKIEGQSCSTDGGSISNPNRICKKLWGSFANVKGEGEGGGGKAESRKLKVES